MVNEILFIPGLFMTKKNIQQLVFYFNHNNPFGYKISFLLNDFKQLETISSDTVVVGYSFGAFMALQKIPNGHNKLILWNPVGLKDHSGFLSYYIAILFKFKIIGFLYRIFGVHSFNDIYNVDSENFISNNIHLGLIAKWKSPIHDKLNSVKTHIVYSKGDQLIAADDLLMDTLLDHTNNHFITERVFTEIVSNIINQNTFFKKKIYFPPMISTPLGVYSEKNYIILLYIIIFFLIIMIIISLL